ncbi:MAG: acyltransferase family protein [Paraprevotella sp.]|nr:acyltransferase family protein [Paraprevotella sp.]
MKERLFFIDWMKALGMLLIIIGHFTPPYLQIITYSCSVQSFFFMSGFLFRREERMRDFALKNIRTLLVPYYVWGILMLVSYNLQQRNWDVFLHSCGGLLLGCNNFIDARGCGELWFIVTLLWLKAFMQLGENKKMIKVFILFSVVLAVFYKNIKSGTQIDYWGIGAFNVFVAYPFFAIGYFLSMYKKDIKKIVSVLEGLFWDISAFVLIMVAIMVVLIAPTNGLVHMVYGGYGRNIFLYLLIGALGILCMFFIAVALSRNKGLYKYARCINTGSVMILGIHIGLINRIRPHLVSIFGNDGWMFELSIVFASVLLLIAFVPMIRFVERYFPIALGYRK